MLLYKLAYFLDMLILPKDQHFTIKYGSFVCSMQINIIKLKLLKFCAGSEVYAQILGCVFHFTL